MLLPSDTHRKPIMSITAVLIPFLTYLLTFQYTFGHTAVSHGLWYQTGSHHNGDYEDYRVLECDTAWLIDHRDDSVFNVLCYEV
jgi:hypothetical protein